MIDSTPPTNPLPSGPPDAILTRVDDLRRQLEDALEVLEYVVESGFTGEDGATVAPEIVATIKITAAKLGVTRRASREDSGPSTTQPSAPIAASDWIAFELAFHKLSILVNPVTAATLRNTEDVGSWRIRNLPPAQAFSRWLWFVASGFAVFVVAGEWGMQHFGPVLEGDAGWENTGMQLMQILIPYGYGGLGACVYLLRSAHQYIYQRSFDLRRKPEYFNRILLGTIGGGAIILLVEHVTTDDGGVINLSSAALGFLAGYSTDFLFSAIERVISALLPKVNLESVRRRPPSRPALAVDTTGAGLKELLDRFDRAKTDEEKKLYQSLIEKLRNRL